jgi:hypothetical protein
MMAEWKVRDFKFFSQLPPELQLIVWESAVSNLNPYVTTIYTAPASNRLSIWCNRVVKLCTLKTPKAILSLLHTYTTSRKVALK